MHERVALDIFDLWTGLDGRDGVLIKGAGVAGEESRVGVGYAGEGGVRAAVEAGRVEARGPGSVGGKGGGVGCVFEDY